MTEDSFQKAINKAWKEVTRKWPVPCLICGKGHIMSEVKSVHPNIKKRLASLGWLKSGHPGAMILVEDNMSDEEIRKKIRGLHD